MCSSQLWHQRQLAAGANGFQDGNALPAGCHRTALCAGSGRCFAALAFCFVTVSKEYYSRVQSVAPFNCSVLYYVLLFFHLGVVTSCMQGSIWVVCACCTVVTFWRYWC